VMTAKHRVFQFLGEHFLPDQKLVVIGLDDGYFLGVLSSHVHIIWSLAAGSWLGVGNDPVYVKTRCFEAFAFPAATEDQQTHLRDLAERLDAHRKRQQAAHPDLTLTGMYNVLDKLRSGEPLTAKERMIHEHGLVSVLRQLHDEIDAAVLDAYGWNDLTPLLRVAHGNTLPDPAALVGARSRAMLPAGDKEEANGIARERAPTGSAAGVGQAEARRAFDEAILERLVALNAERAAEEARGLVRWLRPEFQHPTAQAVPEQAELAATETDDPTAAPVTAAKPQPWPKDTVAQVRAVADALASSPVPLTVDQLATRFTARGPWKKRLPQLLDMLVALGRAQETEGRYGRLA